MYVCIGKITVIVAADLSAGSFARCIMTINSNSALTVLETAFIITLIYRVRVGDILELFLISTISISKC